MTVFSEDEMWRAVVECNEEYDGSFFYGVLTTRIFCRPSCRSKLPLRKNVVFFNDSKEALEKDFRPCKRCRPDLLTYDPATELIDQVKDYIRKNYPGPIDMRSLARDLGASYSRLSKIFKEAQGISMVDYLTRVRVDASLHLLKDREMKVIDIAYSVGFQSLSNYYRSFKRETGLTPGEYREITP